MLWEQVLSPRNKSSLLFSPQAIVKNNLYLPPELPPSLRELSNSMDPTHESDLGRESSDVAEQQYIIPSDPAEVGGLALTGLIQMKHSRI